MKCINIFKRISLVCPIGSAFIFGFIENSRLNYYAVMTMLSLSTYSILINFPYFSKFMHKRPMYYEDLEDEEDADYYQKIFIRTINIPLSIFVAFLSGYFIYKVKGTELTVFEIVGVVGGNISVYNNLQRKVGQILIDFLHWYRNKQLKRRLSVTENKDVELNKI